MAEVVEEVEREVISTFTMDPDIYLDSKARKGPTLPTRDLDVDVAAVPTRSPTRHIVPEPPSSPHLPLLHSKTAEIAGTVYTAKEAGLGELAAVFAVVGYGGGCGVAAWDH